MRPIKFRAWYEGKMFYDVQKAYDTLSGRVVDCEGKDIEYDWQNFGHVLQDAEVMQFTGLHDKNGKEIWEGDIVQSKGRIAEVQWREHQACFLAWSGFNPSSFYLSNDLKCEVLGNVYENPKLLDSK